MREGGRVEKRYHRRFLPEFSLRVLCEQKNAMAVTDFTSQGGGDDLAVPGGNGDEKTAGVEVGGVKRPLACEKDEATGGDDDKRLKTSPSAEEESAARQALDEAKRAALARILEAMAAPAEEPEPAAAADEADVADRAEESTHAPSGTSSRPQEAGDGDGSSSDDEELTADKPVADVDIVEFLRSETEAVVGLALSESTKSQVGVVVEKEAVYERREPRMGPPSSWALVAAKKEDESAPKASSLPPGARPAQKCTGNWAVGGSAGGVSFARPPPGTKFLRPHTLMDDSPQKSAAATGPLGAVTPPRPPAASFSTSRALRPKFGGNPGFVGGKPPWR